VAILAIVFILYVGNAILLSYADSVFLKVVLASVLVAIATVIAANYVRIRQRIDAMIGNNYVDVRLSIASSEYGDVLSLGIVLFSVVYWFRTMLVNIFWGLFGAPFFVCLRACGSAKEVRFFFFGSKAVFWDPDSGTIGPLPTVVQGSIVLYYMWPAVFVIGVLIGGLMLLKSSNVFLRKVTLTLLCATAIYYSVELGAVAILRDKISWQTEIPFLTQTIPLDVAVIGAGLFSSWIFFRPFRTSNLTRLRVLLSFVPKRDRQQTVKLLEDLIAVEKQAP
jgi:hypothetical protein